MLNVALMCMRIWRELRNLAWQPWFSHQPPTPF